MGDTQIPGTKVFITGTLKACCLYVFADAALDIGQELQSMKWDGMGTSSVVGWVLVKLGGIALMVKAFYSNSSK